MSRSSLRVLVCAERLLFRFGLDRVLLLLTRVMRERGHRVDVIAARLDDRVVAGIADGRQLLPLEDVPYIDHDEFVAAWLEERWEDLLDGPACPDLALVGGWPFLASIPVLRDRGVPAVFLDCGAVPLDGLVGGALEVQRQLRRARRLYLPDASAILAISEFVAESQSRVDAPHLQDVRSILLGADHLAGSMWSRHSVDIPAPDPGSPVARVRDTLGTSRRLVLNLGRWEPGGYKRSEAVFDICRRLLDRGIHDFLVGLLEQPDAVDVPADLREHVLPLGFPDDEELVEIMELAVAGISVSGWEGFNLPVAEMQWLGKPALALDLAAHPEVVCHPWCLAADLDELADKLVLLHEGTAPPAEELRRSVAEFRAGFAWKDVQRRYAEALEAVAATTRPTILVDISCACRDPANTGVVRVARQLSRQLQRHARVVFGIWHQESERYVAPTAEEYERLAAYHGPHTGGLPVSSPGARRALLDELALRRRSPVWLLLPEIVQERRARHIRRCARSRGMQVAAVFFDAIPVSHPELVCDAAFRDNHADYMTGLTEVDVVLPISAASGRALESFWARRRLPPAPVHTVPLPAEFGEIRRRRSPRRLSGEGPFEILSVSTLEPRKNHLALLAAARRLDRLAPSVDWRLTLVGNRYAGAETIALAVQAACCAEPRIRWLGVVDDRTLHRLYEDCALTVYPSLVEGYGMPIVESLWHGTPVLCHREGVMAELAAAGGCLVADLRDPDEFAAALARLATDPVLYADLSRQAVGRTMRTWDDYARDLLAALPRRGAPAANPQTPAVATPRSPCASF